MKKNQISYLALLALAALFLVGCWGPDTLYLAGEGEALVKVPDLGEGHMVQRFIYNGRDLNFEYSLEGQGEIVQVKYQLFLATRNATSLKVSVSVVQAGNMLPLGSDVLEITGNEGKKFEGLIRGRNLKTAPGDILRFTLSNTGGNEAVIFLSPTKKETSFIQVRLH
ncbi:hypothetical protein ACFL0I_00055 [Gemmatimonadota bacterium]